MNTYVIRRKSNWANEEELSKAAACSKKVGETEMADQVRWIRSYVVKEEDGRLGTVCIYQAVSAEAIKEHACRAGLQADEITEVADTVVIREDPVKQTV